MEPEQQASLAHLLEMIETSEETRKRFISSPLSTLNHELGINLNKTPEQISVGDRILLSALQSDDTLKAIEDVHTDLAAKRIDQATANGKIAQALVDCAPKDVKDQIEEWRRAARRTIDPGGRPKFEPENPAGPQVLANPVVAVDVALVVSEAAVVNS